MLRALEIESPYGAQRLEFSRYTFLKGSPSTGKSYILRIIYSIFHNIDKIRVDLGRRNRRVSIKLTIELPQEIARHIVRRLERSWNIDLSDWDRRVLVSVSSEKSRSEYVLKMSIIDEPILQIVTRDDIIVIRRPVNIELKNTIDNVRELMKTVRELPQTHMFSTYEEEIHLMTDLVDSIISSIRQVKIYRIGPYIDYQTCIDVTELKENIDDDYIGRHGENTLLVLSRTFADGRSWSYLAKLLSYLERNGISRTRCGIVNSKLTLTYILDGELMICPELSCTIKSLLAYYVQILAAERGSILLIDNFDYCMTEDACRLIINLIKSLNKNIQLIVEIHNEKMADILEKEGKFTPIEVPRELIHYIKYFY